MTEQNNQNIKDTGLIHVYTGTGKGKTTAAIGLAARAIGSGLSVCYCSFHKHPEKYGYHEMKSLKKLGVQIYNFAKYHPHMDDNVTEETINAIKKEVKEAINTLTDLLKTTNFDVLILDEIFISIRDKYLDEEVLLNFIKCKPEKTELVLTGRAAPNKIISLAHYVTYMECVKHPYSQNISSRKGIEY